MTEIDFSKIPVKLVMENDIVSDIAYGDESIHSKIKFLVERVKGAKDPRDFFIVVLNRHNNSIKGIITASELGKILDKLVDKNKSIIFGEYTKTAICLKYKEPIQRVLDLFEDIANDVILITNDDCKYMGKIKRTTFKKRLDELIKSLSG